LLVSRPLVSGWHAWRT
jgi:hypothetical protein